MADSSDYATLTNNPMQQYFNKSMPSSQNQNFPPNNYASKTLNNNTNSNKNNNISAQPDTSTATVAPTATTNLFEDLLRKLDAERGINSEIYCDENETIESSNVNNMLYGVHATEKMYDVINENVFIEFINSQVKLSLEDSNVVKTTEMPKKQQQTQTKSQKRQQQQSNQEDMTASSSFLSSDYQDYLIISAARTNVVQRLHKPVWKSQRLLDKTSWSGYLENMQYVATLNDSTITEQPKEIDETEFKAENVPNQTEEYWLSDDIIDPNESSYDSQGSKMQTWVMPNRLIQMLHNAFAFYLYKKELASKYFL